MNSSTELDLAEIDYVLRLAQERLQLFGDTRTAAQALAIADQQLSAFDNPLYLGLQREIASAQQALLQAAAIDYPTVYRTVDTLQNDIGSLPFKGAEVPAEISQPSEDAGWWTRIRNAFSGLVTVRRQTSAEQDLPVLADQEVIRQHAWLELEVARLAAMRRDQDAWVATLNRFSATLDKWFEPGAPAMGEVKKLLAELQSINVDPPLPDISAPWVALQAVRAAGISAPATSAPSVPASKPALNPDSNPDSSSEPGAGDSGQ
jgi:uroporphyrin-3 C-methyltransferase